MPPMSKQEYLQNVYQYATALIRDNFSDEEIIDALIDDGLEATSAQEVVTHLRKIRWDGFVREHKLQVWQGLAITLFFIPIMVIFGLIWGDLGRLIGLAGMAIGIWRIWQHGKPLFLAYKAQYEAAIEKSQS